MPERVMIGCPVRNRAWVLPQYLAALVALDYPPARLEFCFVVNDCVDATPRILQDFSRDSGLRVQHINMDLGAGQGYRRGEYSLARLARLRNTLLEAFLASGCDCLFSVDSDILPPAGALRSLVEDRCQVVSALVCNGHQVGDASLYNVLRERSPGHYVYLQDFPRDRLFPVDCTGAAMLIRRQVVERGARYSAVNGSEDIGFCESVRQQGLVIFCDGRVECLHLMREEAEGTKKGRE